MPQVRAGATKRWARNAANAQVDYKEGVQNAGQSWEQNTVAAEANHKAGTEAALREGRFVIGVKKSGAAWYQSQSSTLGADRFAQGVNAGEQTYEEGFAPVKAVIEATKLPPRGPKGDTKNYERVKVMGMALRALKTGGGK